MGPSVSREIASPPTVVWDLLTHVAAWPEWGPSVAGATVPGGVVRAGARGTVRTAVGVSLPFEVTHFEEGRRWAWSVAGVPATDHRVRPTAGGCVVTFGVPWWAPGYLAVCAVALRRIERLAAGA
ncbi:SRPBCC family protein [Aeromicrobium stalagmiti]|uniref:SRPBCC family protein n=1 Tax=Aeromicrobium stalagmiti TaxID=2738988 RepID=UPI0015682054|nr:SRPBCC family protein [Aeromicrobium stalagmiti]NRQ48704.1 SRPBCC family protein [Aeromicrobium stalagmiti]